MRRRQPANDTASAGADAQGKSSEGRSEAILREFAWDLVAINTHLEDIRRFWAESLGISGPQWLILMAVSELDQGKGVSVGEVSSKLQVNSTFISAQSKGLERSGLLTRTASASDARIVLMSLTEMARKEVGKLAGRRDALNAQIFADIGDRTLREVSQSLKMIRKRAEKAARQLELDAD
ncbi:DNA-binding MarR family transcriptional regulator [Bradyrhizobium sp. GM22.5]